MADQERIQYLFDQYLGKKCTPAEVGELIMLLQDEKAEEMLSSRMRELWEQIKEEQKTYPVDWQRIYDQATQDQDLPGIGSRSHKRILFRAVAAVAALFMLSGGLYLWRHGVWGEKDSIGKQATGTQPQNGQTVLTLSNGATVMPDQAPNGILTRQGHTRIVKLDSNELAYEPLSSEAGAAQAAQYNTLTTPRGGQYQVRLPDGTKVWLNAASSIRYPVAFTGKERRVEITGEAYFEVWPNAARPFMVTAGNMQVKVLGTHFNINAYTDEASVKATLLEGSISVKAANGPAVAVTPGQQAQLSKEGEIRLIKKADVDEAVAWKKGLFVFHSADLPAVMRELTRWYDVEVIYKDSYMSGYHFSGTIRRQEELPKILKMLELTGGIHFEIEGKKIIVSP